VWAAAVTDLVAAHPERFRAEILDVTDTVALREVADRTFADLGRVDVVVSNAGYGLFGAGEEYTDDQIRHIIDTNLLGSIQLLRASLPHLRAQGGGRIIQLSSYGGQVAFPGSSMYHATKWGIEGFAEAIAPEVAPFGIGITIVEPGGARTEFRHGSAQVAAPIAAYDATPAHDFRARLDPRPGDRRSGQDGHGHHRQRRRRAGPAAAAAWHRRLRADTPGPGGPARGPGGAEGSRGHHRHPGGLTA
jgi:NAD(P)-dependent dehydrogenase (short-subunit alcohol dehydrogenase family)